MTARTAEKSYWMFRNLERAESLSRMLSTAFLFSLEENPEKHPLLYLVDNEIRLENKEVAEFFLVWEEQNPSSLISAIKNLWEDARVIRENLHANMCQPINDIYLWLIHPETKSLYTNKRYDFYKCISDYCQLILGSYYNYVYRDEYYHFMDLGIQIERANQVIFILDDIIANWIDKFQNSTENNKHKIESFSYLLACCASTDTYLKQSYNFEPRSIVRFFMHETLSPFSISYCLETSYNNILAIISKGKYQQSKSLIIQVQNLINSIAKMNFDDLLQNGITSESQFIQKSLSDINESINKEFFQLTYLVKEAAT